MVLTLLQIQPGRPTAPSVRLSFPGTVEAFAASYTSQVYKQELIRGKSVMEERKALLFPLRTKLVVGHSKEVYITFALPS